MLSHAVHEARLVGHKPVSPPCQHASPQMSQRLLQMSFPGCFGGGVTQLELALSASLTPGFFSSGQPRHPKHGLAVSLRPKHSLRDISLCAPPSHLISRWNNWPHFEHCKAVVCSFFCEIQVVTLGTDGNAKNPLPHHLRCWGFGVCHSACESPRYCLVQLPVRVHRAH